MIRRDAEHVRNRGDTIFPREVDWSSSDPAYFVTLGRDCRQIANDCDRALDRARAAAGRRVELDQYGALSFKRDRHRDLAERLEKRARELYAQADRSER